MGWVARVVGEVFIHRGFSVVVAREFETLAMLLVASGNEPELLSGSSSGSSAGVSGVCSEVDEPMVKSHCLILCRSCSNEG
jgi:hypothetical protein